MKPATQLPQGRFPASGVVIWVVAALVMLIGLGLAVVVPVALSPADTTSAPPVAPVNLAGDR